jgi:hypothetical protein
MWCSFSHVSVFNLGPRIALSFIIMIDHPLSLPSPCLPYSQPYMFLFLLLFLSCIVLDFNFHLFFIGSSCSNI